ncbi:MAG: hypothetical protein RSA01_04610 [Clostridium sp.]|uniref:hypothetical protein n=1 Tax=Clostridium sp. TaxID=1506 RepID=UPI002FC84554
MSINSINNDYIRNIGINTLENNKDKNINSSKDKASSVSFKDVIDLSMSNNIKPTASIGSISMDKGTAANTTVFVNRSTFNQIMNYTTNSQDCQWDELGIDDNKRWIVVNGQRFECPLSEEEKEMRRRMRMGLSDLIGQSPKKDYKEDDKLSRHLNIRIDESNNINIQGDNGALSNPKIQSLIKNDKVMNMFANIIKLNGGKDIGLSI